MKRYIDYYLDAVTKKSDGGGGKPAVLIAKTLTANGTYTAKDDGADGYSAVNVAVPPKPPILEEASVTYTANGTNVVEPSFPFDGMSKVTVNVDVASEAPKFTDLSYFYYQEARLYDIPPETLDTSDVTRMVNMFYFCVNITNLDLSGWNTSNVKDMSYMFDTCSGLETVNVSGWNTSNVASTRSMFSGCYSLTALDLSGWDTSNITNMSGMFNSCNHITALDLTGWDTNRVSNMSNFIGSCRALKDIYIRDNTLRDGFLKFRLPASGIFNQVRTNGGHIHLSATLQSVYTSATNWSAYTDIMVFDQP